MMSDGRSLVSNWQPETLANHKIASDNNLTSNWMYRKYMIENANDIMKTNFVESANDTGYTIPPLDTIKGQSTPFFAESHDQIAPYSMRGMTDLHQAYLAKS